MCLVSGPTNRIGYNDDPKAPIYRTENRCKHTDIGFTSIHDKGVQLGAAQEVIQPAFCPWGINALSKTLAGGTKRERDGTSSTNFGSILARVTSAHRR